MVELIIIIIGIAAAWDIIRMWRKAKMDTDALIDSILKNSAENLGYAPDAKSVAFLARHPILSAKIWKMMSEGGASWGSWSIELQKYQDDCGSLLGYIQNQRFRQEYPCACAVMQYTVYLCDNTLTRNSRCKHPKDELNRMTDRTEKA